METTDAPDDDRAKAPNDDHGQQIVAPLNAQARDRFRSQEKQHRDAEVRRIPDVTAFYTENVLRHDGNDAANCVRPKGGRANENANANASNVGTGEIGEFPAKDAAEDEFRKQTGDDRKTGLAVAFENAEGKVPGQQDASDKSGSEI